MHRENSMTHIERKRPMRQSVMRWFSKALEDTRKIKTDGKNSLRKNHTNTEDTGHFSPTDLYNTKIKLNEADNIFY
jgi:hypothetical protein